MSKRCKKYRSSDLMFYIRGKMSQEEESELQHHLFSCEECSAELERLRAMIDSVEESRASSTTLSFKRIYFAVATAAAVIIGGVLSIQFWSSESSPTSPIEFNPAPQYNALDELKMEQDTTALDSINEESLEIQIYINH